MKKKKLIKTLLEILEEWGTDLDADLDGTNNGYYDALVEILKKEEEDENERKI